jgi:hypothetical protein
VCCQQYNSITLTYEGRDIEGCIVWLDLEGYCLASWECIALKDNNVLIALLPEA